MAQVRGVVTRWLEESVPGWVEFVLVDAQGATHAFHEKTAVLTLELLLPTSRYPRELWVEVDVLSEDGASAAIRPRHDIDSIEGVTEFTLPLVDVRAIEEPSGGGPSMEH